MQRFSESSGMSPPLLLMIVAGVGGSLILFWAVFCCNQSDSGTRKMTTAESMAALEAAFDDGGDGFDGSDDDRYNTEREAQEARSRERHHEIRGH